MGNLSVCLSVRIPYILFKLYKEFRSAGGLRRPLRSPRMGDYMKFIEADRRPRLNIVFSIIVVANWRLDSAKSPRLQCFKRKQLGRHFGFAS